MDTMSNKSLKITLVIVSLLLIWSVILSNKKNDQYKELQTELNKVQSYSDSLHDELFSTSVELGRREIAYELFLERNPKAAKQYDSIISHETE